MIKIHETISLEKVVELISQLRRELKTLVKDSYKSGYEDAVRRIIVFLETGKDTYI